MQFVEFSLGVTEWDEADREEISERKQVPFSAQLLKQVGGIVVCQWVMPSSVQPAGSHFNPPFLP